MYITTWYEKQSLWHVFIPACVYVALLLPIWKVQVLRSIKIWQTRSHEQYVASFTRDQTIQILFFVLYIIAMTILILLL